MQEVFRAIIEELKQESIIVDDDAGHRAVDIIEQAAVEYNNGWIPCSARLPNREECQQNDCRFIVTDGNRRYQRRFDYKSKEFIEPMWHNTFNSYVDKEVIAWQSLPEPYQPSKGGTQ